MAETVNDYMETDLGNVAPNPRGEYSETAAYEYLDLVAYAGGSYLCIQEDGTVAGTAPEKGMDTDIWQVVSLPGELTPEYVAMHDDVVNKAASVAEDAKNVASDREQVEGMKENVAALQEQVRQDAEETKKNRESSAGFASLAEESRKSASESEENIRMLVDGFDTHVEEQKQAAEEDITDSRQTAIKAIAAQQVLSTNAVKAEGEKAIQQTAEDAASTAADREAVTELAGTVSEQASKAAQDAAQTASDKAETAAYKENAKESKEQAVAAADSVKDIVAQVQQNTADLIEKAPVMVETVTSYAGEDVCVTDSAEMPLQGLKIYGRSWQETTTGKNLCSIKSVQLAVDKVNSKIVPWTKKSRIYFSADTEAVDNSYLYILIRYYDKDKNILGTNGYAGMITGGRTERSFGGTGAGTDGGNVDLTIVEYVRTEIGMTDVSTSSFIDNIMLCDEANLPYEPYTGGKPSPSLDYPQEIESVGRVLSTGKNLLNADEYYSEFKQDDGTYKGIISKIYSKHIMVTKDMLGKSFAFSIEVIVPSNLTYAIIQCVTNGAASFSNRVVGGNVGKMNVVFCPETLDDYLCITYGSGGGAELVFYNLQLEEGSVATSYEPYTGGAPGLYEKDVEIGLTGKNLFDDNAVLKGYYINDTSGDTMVESGSYSSDYIPVVAGKSYRIETLEGVKGQWGAFYDINKTYISGILGYMNKNIIAPDNAAYMRLTISNYNSNSNFANNFFVVQTDSKISPTDFEPYKQPQSLSITTLTGLPAIPVPTGTSGITYTDADGQAWIADEIDFARGKYIQRVWQAEFDGSKDENWKVYEVHKGFNIQALTEEARSKRGFSNSLKIASSLTESSESVIIGYNSKNIYILNSSFYDNSLNDNGLSNWKAHLAEHPLKVMTYLDTPVETDLSEEQLQAYRSIRSNKPTTIFSNDAGAQMDVSYAIDTKTYIDNKFAELASAIVSSASESE